MLTYLRRCVNCSAALYGLAWCLISIQGTSREILRQWLPRVTGSCIAAMDTELSMVVWGDGTVCDSKEDLSEDSSSSSAVSAKKSKKSKSSKTKPKSVRKATKKTKSQARRERACTSETMSSNYSTWKKTPVHSLFVTACEKCWTSELYFMTTQVTQSDSALKKGYIDIYVYTLSYWGIASEEVHRWDWPHECQWVLPGEIEWVSDQETFLCSLWEDAQPLHWLAPWQY